MPKSPSAPVIIPDVTIHDALFGCFKNNAAKTALVNGLTGESLTYQEVTSVIGRVSSGLNRLGVRKGDIVVAFSPNSHEYIFMLFAVMTNGAAISTLNPSYTSYELAHALKNSGTPWIFTDKKLLPLVKETLNKSNISTKGIIVAGDVDTPLPNGLTSIQTLINDDGSLYPSSVKFNCAEDVAIIPYSSGTTGLPKGVMLTHRNIIAMMVLFTEANAINNVEKPEFYVTHPDIQIHSSTHGPQEQLVLMSYLPFFHVYGMLAVLIFGMAAGAKIITLPRYKTQDVLACIEKYKVTMLPLVPPVVLEITRSPLVKKYDLSSIQRIGCGAAPLGRDAELEFQRLVKVDDVRQGYGMTETTTCVTITPGNWKIKSGSVGVPLANTEIQIVDPDTKKVLGPYEKGEVCARGPQIMKGYLNNEKATREIIDADGWLHTGDIGYYDDDDYLFIVDRIKELIKYKGFQVAPAELEALLLTHHEIDDAAVIGVPDKDAGEIPRAYVVTTPGSKLTAEQVKQFVADHVSNFKHLRGGVEFMERIPKSETGKILRRVLRDQATKPNSKL